MSWNIVLEQNTELIVGTGGKSVFTSSGKQSNPPYLTCLTASFDPKTGVLSERYIQNWGGSSVNLLSCVIV